MSSLKSALTYSNAASSQLGHARAVELYLNKSVRIPSIFTDKEKLSELIEAQKRTKGVSLQECFDNVNLSILAGSSTFADKERKAIAKFIVKDKKLKARLEAKLEENISQVNAHIKVLQDFVKNEVFKDLNTVEPEKVEVEIEA